MTYHSLSVSFAGTKVSKMKSVVFKIRELKPIVYFADEKLSVATHPQSHPNINVLSTYESKVKHGLPKLIENAILFIFFTCLTEISGNIVNILLICSQRCFYARRLVLFAISAVHCTQCFQELIINQAETPAFLREPPNE